jgi:hypothetical protein
VSKNERHQTFTTAFPLLIAAYVVVEHEGEVKREKVYEVFFPMAPVYPDFFSKLSQVIYEKLWEYGKSEQQSPIIHIARLELKIFSDSELESACLELKDYCVIEFHQLKDEGLNCWLTPQFKKHLSGFRNDDKTGIVYSKAEKKHKIHNKCLTHIGNIRKFVAKCIDDTNKVAEMLPQGEKGKKGNDYFIIRIDCNLTDLKTALDEKDFDKIREIYRGVFLADIENKVRENVWLSPQLRDWIQTNREQFAKQVSGTLLQILQEAKQQADKELLSLAKDIKHFCEQRELNDESLNNCINEVLAKPSSSSEEVLQKSSLGLQKSSLGSDKVSPEQQAPDEKASKTEPRNTVINNIVININNIVNNTPSETDQRFRNIRNYLLAKMDEDCRRVEQVKPVENQWIDTYVSMSNSSFYSQKPFRVRDNDNRLLKVFFEQNRLMVLLGEAGMGKTLVLYDIAQTLIAQARSDVEKPVPLIFHLADWESKALSFEDWLKHELIDQLLLGKQEIETDFRLLLKAQRYVFLLDGFDNLLPQQRANRLEYINAFIEEYGLLDLGGVIIASRPEEYESAKQQFLADNPKKRHFRTEATIQPLTLDESRAYIETHTPSQRLPLDTLFGNEAFRQLLNTPLWLTLFLKTAQSHPDTIDDKSDTDISAIQNNLISRYVEARFDSKERESQEPPYTREQVTTWLGQIAKSIPMGGTFHIEALSPKLLDEKQQHRYQWWFTALFGIVFGALMGSLAGLIFGKRAAEQIAEKKPILPEALMDIHQVLTHWIAHDALIYKIYLVLSYGSIGIFSGLLMSTLTFLLFRRIYFPVFLSGYLALSLGITGLLCDGLRWFYMVVISYGILGFLLGLMIKPVHTNPLEIQLRQETLFNHEKLFNRLRNRLLDLLRLPKYQLLLLKLRLLNLVQTAPLTNRQPEIQEIRLKYEQLLNQLQVTGLALSFIPVSMLLILGFSLFIPKLTLGVALLQGFILGLSMTIGYSFYHLRKQSDWKTPVFWPSQKITLALKRSALMILTIGGFITLLVTGLSSYHLGWPGNLSFGLRVGMLPGIIFGFMFYGGVEVLKHFTLRWIMYQQGMIPWRYTRFLEYAKQLIFIKPQSGGYAFIHDWFQEYFSNKK